MMQFHDSPSETQQPCSHVHHGIILFADFWDFKKDSVAENIF